MYKSDQKIIQDFLSTFGHCKSVQIGSIILSHMLKFSCVQISLCSTEFPCSYIGGELNLADWEINSTNYYFW